MMIFLNERRAIQEFYDGLALALGDYADRLAVELRGAHTCRQAGEKAGHFLAHEIQALRGSLAMAVETRQQYIREYLALLDRQNQDTDPRRTAIAARTEALAEQTRRAAQAEANNLALKQQVEGLQRLLDTQQQAQEARIADLNRLVADLHLQLSGILGADYRRTGSPEKVADKGEEA